VVTWHVGGFGVQESETSCQPLCVTCPSVQVLVSCLNLLMPEKLTGQLSVLSENVVVQVTGAGAG
jgi:hypothetical protein